jgi:hypothetical protein
MLIAELRCSRCGAISYRAASARHRSADAPCTCGGARGAVRYLGDRRRHRVPVPYDRREQRPGVRAGRVLPGVV